MDSHVKLETTERLHYTLYIIHYSLYIIHYILYFTLSASPCISQPIDSLPSQFSQHLANVLNFLLPVAIKTHFVQALLFLGLFSCLMAFSSGQSLGGSLHLLFPGKERRLNLFKKRSRKYALSPGTTSALWLFNPHTGRLPGGQPKGDLTLGLWQGDTWK